MLRNPLLFVGVVLALGACRGEVVEGPSPAVAPLAPPVESITLAVTPNVHRVGDVITAGQPDRAALRIARDEHGVKTVINLRRAEELGDFDEKGVATELGLSYVHVPFGGPESLSDEIFATLRAHLRDQEARPLLFHCKSANRVGAIWYAFRVLDEGADPGEALAEARSIGLRSAGHLERTKAYVTTQSASDG